MMKHVMFAAVPGTVIAAAVKVLQSLTRTHAVYAMEPEYVLIVRDRAESISINIEISLLNLWT